jgi:hypothetical protein
MPRRKAAKKTATFMSEPPAVAGGPFVDPGEFASLREMDLSCRRLHAKAQSCKENHKVRHSRR